MLSFILSTHEPKKVAAIKFFNGQSPKLFTSKQAAIVYSNKLKELGISHKLVLGGK